MKKIIALFILTLSLLFITAYADGAVKIDNTFAEVGKPLTVTVEGYEDCTFKWNVDYSTAGVSDTFTPKREDLESFISVTAYDKGGNVIGSDSIFFSKLPVLYITTEDGKEVTSKEKYIKGTMSVQGNAQYTEENCDLYDGDLKIRGRGNSSWYEFTKKPYKIKLDSKADLFGMGKNKHWVLIANEMDESLMRDVITYDVSRKIGLVTLDCTWVDIIMNGEYAGNYLVCEHLRTGKDRVDVFDWEDIGEDIADAIYEANPDTIDEYDHDEMRDDINRDLRWITSGKYTFNDVTYNIKDYVELPDNVYGGVIMEYNRLMDEVSQFETDRGSKITVSYPEFLATNNDLFNYTKGYLNKVETLLGSNENWYGNYFTTYKGKDVGYCDLIDFDSYVAMWVLDQIFCNYDLGSKSTYMFMDVGGKLVMGPTWDWDWASGVKSPWSPISTEGINMICMQYVGLSRDPYFLSKSVELYHSIRGGILEDLIKKDGIIDTYDEYIIESALKNEGLWHYNLGHRGDVENLKEWLKKRLAYLDKAFASKQSLYEAMGAGSQWLKGPDRLASVKVENTVRKPDGTQYPADYYIDCDNNVKVTVSYSGEQGKKAVVTVNNKKGGTYDLEKKKAQMTLPRELFSEEPGSYNTITARILNNNGELLGYNFCTVTGLEFSSLTGEGTTENPYEILTKNDLYIMARKINCGEAGYQKATYSLKNNIIFDGIPEIGIKGNAFKGTFYGNGYTITSSTGRVFDTIGKNGVVTNLKIDGANITWDGSKKSFYYIIANTNKGTVTDCSVKGNIDKGLVLLEYNDNVLVSASSGDKFEINGNTGKIKVVAGRLNNYGFISIK